VRCARRILADCPTHGVQKPESSRPTMGTVRHSLTRRSPENARRPRPRSPVLATLASTPVREFWPVPCTALPSSSVPYYLFPQVALSTPLRRQDPHDAQVDHVIVPLLSLPPLPSFSLQVSMLPASHLHLPPLFSSLFLSAPRTRHLRQPERRVEPAAAAAPGSGPVGLPVAAIFEAVPQP